MKLTKLQLRTLAELAEQPAETPETFVEALIEKYWDLLSDHKMYAGFAKVQGIPFVMGPYTTRKQVERLGATPIAFVSPEGWKKAIANADKMPEPKGDWKTVAEDAAAFKAARR